MMKQLKAANDNYIRESRRPIACPTLARFIRLKDTTSIRAIIFWRDLTKPGDPFNPHEYLDAGIHSIFSGSNLQPEREMNKLFTPKELAYLEAAANDNNGKPTFDDNGQAHLGGLTFRNGVCVTPGVFNDKKEFGKIKTTTTPNGFMVLGEEAFATSFEADLVRESQEREYRRQLGDFADVLDMACGDYTAKDVGERFGYSGKTAERQGIRMIDEAIKEFLSVNDENDQIAA